MNIEEITSQITQFRQDLYELLDLRADALLELLDALASSPNVRSVVELSLGSLFRRQYSSVCDAIAHLLPVSNPDTEGEDRKTKSQELMRLKARYLPKPQHRKFWLFGTDGVSIPRPFSSTLSDRTFVYQPNTVRGNKPIAVGHQYSVLAAYPEKYHEDDPPWVIALQARRIGSAETATTVAAEQLEDLMTDQSLPFYEDWCVHVADSTYSAVRFLGQTEEHENLVNVVRSRRNRVFYHQPPVVTGKRTRGHPRWYGERFNLRDSSTWGEPDRVEATSLTTHKGRTYRVELEAWDDKLMRGKKDLPMYQKPFTLIQVRVLAEDGQPVFKRPLWLIVMGERRQELSLVEAWEAYVRRYDVEHFFRFGKQRLLMASYQTPEVDHEENWLEIVSLAYMLLWLARELAEALPRPWEQYLPQRDGQVASPSGVQRDFERIIREIGTPAQPPKPRGNSLGRTQGTRMPRRERHPVIKKSQKIPEKASDST